MDAGQTDARDVRDMANDLTPDLRGVVGAFAEARLAAGGTFLPVQAAAISALVQELARVIASGPPHWHRKQSAVVIETLGAMVREHAVLFASGESR